MFHWLRQQHWHYRIRLTGDTLVRFGDRQVVPVAKLCPPKAAAHFYHNIYLLGEGIGPVHLALAQLDEPNADPWYVVSDEPTDLNTLEEFSLRFDMEEKFLDDKSNGFQVEDTGLETKDAMEWLFLVIAVATLHFTSVGVEVVKLECRHWVDTHWDRGMSYLKIGILEYYTFELFLHFICRERCTKYPPYPGLPREVVQSNSAPANFARQPTAWHKSRLNYRL